MDTKTLEYMGARVDKARKLQEGIMNTNSKIQRLTEFAIRDIRIDCINSGYVNLSGSLPLLKEELIKILTAYRDQLQAELDEL